MPFYLRDRDFSSDMATVHSALIVPCRFCPAASLAVRERKPYIELFSARLVSRQWDSMGPQRRAAPGRANNSRCGHTPDP